MILPTYHSSLRPRNVAIGHIVTFSPVNTMSLDGAGDSDQSDTTSETESELGHTASVQRLRPPGEKRARVRVLSESEACSGAEFRDGVSEEEAPFRGRSQSAPAALWAAKRYGRQLRRMSDEFDTWLEKGQEVKRVHAVGAARQIKTSRSWFSFLWSPRETEDELHGNQTPSGSEAAQ
ncbi:hypothetical protein AAFF_G00247360 [Aldrovandia affinis]|uniref:BCL2-associated agonist of cell death n=1 Tax=Aldrovandia affinis TaxID=143900 RepID=A0AAD7SVD5_9TELE|nr:hypothetical protein AAFF_G00247360 [Aldrovandia affinis]